MSQPRSLRGRTRAFPGILYLVAPLLSVGCGEAFAVDGGAGGGGAAATATTSQGAGGSSVEASSSPSASSSAATGGAGGTTAEDCTNGGDDDGDGQVDCEDGDCVDFACVEAAPVGWLGPVAFLYGDHDTPPPCEAPWTTEKAVGGGILDAPAPVCSCSCSTPQGATCTQPPVTTYGDAACLNPLIQLPVSPPGQCGNILNGVNVSGALRAPPPLAVGGMCNPVADTLIPEAHFEFSGQLCEGAPMGGGCDAGQACAPRPAPPFEPGLCVYREGTHACPSGTYAFPTTTNAGLDDQRGCTGCACGDPQKTTCTGTTTLSSDLVCLNPVIAVAHDDNCIPFSGAFTSLAYSVDGPDGGNCDPSGGKPFGQATPGPVLTVCCSL